MSVMYVRVDVHLCIYTYAHPHIPSYRLEAHRTDTPRISLSEAVTRARGVDTPTGFLGPTSLLWAAGPEQAETDCRPCPLVVDQEDH